MFCFFSRKMAMCRFTLQSSPQMTVKGQGSFFRLRWVYICVIQYVDGLYQMLLSMWLLMIKSWHEQKDWRTYRQPSATRFTPFHLRRMLPLRKLPVCCSACKCQHQLKWDQSDRLRRVKWQIFHSRLIKSDVFFFFFLSNITCISPSWLSHRTAMPCRPNKLVNTQRDDTSYELM